MPYRGLISLRRLERLVKAQPTHAPHQLLLGRLLGESGLSPTRSLFHLRRALALAPEMPDAWLEAIASAAQQRRPDEAMAFAEQAIAMFPNRADIAGQAAMGLLENNRSETARIWLERALHIDSGYGPALYNLAVLSQSEGEWEAALVLFERAKAVDTKGALPETCLGDLQLKLGDVVGAIESLDAWLLHHPADSIAISSRLMAAQYQAGITAAALWELHGMWQNQVGAKFQPTSPVGFSPRISGKLRVGLVSGDLRMHPVGIFTIRGIEALDATAIELVAYSGTRSRDALTERFRRCCALWHDIADWSDTRLVETVRRDGIDVLIDMAGHTTDIRLSAFARRMAPVQISWAGYFGTTGCAQIDYIIGDHRLAPVVEKHCYREAILRLPDNYLCYDPPHDAPPITAPPDGPTRFAAFHHPAKINADVARLWAGILRSDQDSASSLHFTYEGFDTARTRQRVTDWFVAEGVEADRLHFSGRLSRADYFTALGNTHICLDPFPYSGGAITCDALWMGVPVVTMPGQSWAGRHSLTHLMAAGLGELVATDGADYARIVIELAADRARLSVLRAELRDQVRTSALCDGELFGRRLTAVLVAVRPLHPALLTKSSPQCGGEPEDRVW